MELPDRVDAKRWEGLEVVDRDDQALGSCVGVFADADTEITEWLLVDVPGHRRAFVPALDATETGGRVRVPFGREQVVTAPQVGDEAQLSKSDERALYDHYGVPVSEDDSASLLPEAAVDPDGAVPDPSTVAAGVAPPVDAPSTASSERTGVTPPVPAAPPEPAPATVEVPRATPSVHDAGPVPTTTSWDRDQGGSPATAAAPLAAVGGLAAAVWIVLRARDRRASRRRQVTATTRRARQQVSTGLAGLSAVAAETSRQASAGASRTSAAAAELRREAAKAAAQRRKEAAKAAAERRKEAAKATARRRKEVGQGVSAVTGAVTHRASDVTGAVADTRSTVAKRARKTRRSFARKLLGTGTALAAGGGYVLGARAGRERYDQIRDAASGVTGRPEVRRVVDTAKDPERRADAVTGLRQQAAHVRDAAGSREDEPSRG